MSVANTVFAAAKGLVETPSGSISISGASTSTGTGMDFGQIAHDDTALSNGAAGPVPSANLGAMPASSSVAVNPSTAAYAATLSAITWANPTAAIAPTYSEAVTPGSLPAHELPAVPQMVQLAQLPTERHAGLTTYAKPAITIGDRPRLLDVSLAAFDVTTLEPLAVDLPSLNPQDLDAGELDTPTVLAYTDDATLIARIQRTLAGSDVLTAAEQELLFDALMLEQARVDMLAVRKVMSDAAARGFSMPTGLVTGAVADIAYDSRRRKQDVAMQVRDETYERAKTLLLDALAKAISIETKHFALHMAYAGKLVETLRFNIRLKAELFNRVVQLFNDKVQLVRTVVAAYRDYVAALEAQDDAIVAQIRGRMAQATTYRADVEMYSAQTGTLKTFAEVEALGVEAQTQLLQEYEAYLVGVRANVDVVKRNIEAYRTAIGTMREVSDAESAKFAAYAEQVSAFASVEDVYAANVNAYAGFWRAENARTSAFSSYVDDSVRALSAESRTFSEYASAQRSYVTALGAKVEAELDNVRTWATANKSRGAFLSAYNRAQAEVTAAENAQNLANSSIRMLGSALDAQAHAESERIRASLTAAQLTAEAGMEQAKLAVRSVSVSVRGSADGDERDRTSTRNQTQNRTSYTTQYTTDH